MQGKFGKDDLDLTSASKQIEDFGKSVEYLGKVIEKTNKKSDLDISISGIDKADQSSETIQTLTKDIETLWKSIKKGKDKSKYFQSLENATVDVKKKWNDLVSQIENDKKNGTFDINSLYTTKTGSKQTDLLRCANAFEALGGNLKELNPQISEFVNNLRETMSNNNPNYQFTVEGFSEAFNVFEKLKELQANIKGVDLDIGFTSSKNDVVDMAKLILDMNDVVDKSIDNVVESYEEEGRAAEETAKKIEKLTQAEMERKLKSEHEKKEVDEWDLNLNYELDDIQKYSTKLEELKENLKYTLSEIVYYNDKLAEGKTISKYGTDYQEQLDYNVSKYHEYANQIEYVQERLQESIRDYTPSAEGENGKELNALIIILKDLHGELLKISSAFSSVDDDNVFNTLTNSIKSMNKSLSETLVKIGNLSDVLQNKDFNLVFNNKSSSNSNPMASNLLYGMDMRSIIRQMKNEKAELDSFLRNYYNNNSRGSINSSQALGQLFSGKELGIINSYSDLVDIPNKFSDAALESMSEKGKGSLQETFNLLQEYFDLVERAAKVKGVDISSITSKYNNNFEEQMRSATKVITGDLETAQETENVFKNFLKGANNIDLTGITLELSKLIEPLERIEKLIQEGFTVNDILNGKPVDTGEEVKGLNAVKESVEAITKSVNEKTEAFEKEGAKVAQIVPVETSYLGKLISALKIINENLDQIAKFSGLDLSNIKIPETNSVLSSDSTSDSGSNKNSNSNQSSDKDVDRIAEKHEASIIRQQKEVKKLEEAQAKAVNANIEREQKEIDIIDTKVAKTIQARQEEEKRIENAQNKAINKALEEEYEDRQKLTEQMARGRETAELKSSSRKDKEELAQAKAINKALEDKYREQNNNEKKLQEQKDSFFKKNLNGIDYEIKKREEEGRLFSKQLKEQMESEAKLDKASQTSISKQEKDYLKKEKQKQKDFEEAYKSAEEQNKKASEAYKKLLVDAKEYYTLLEKESSGNALREKEKKRLKELKDAWEEAVEAKGKYAKNNSGSSDSLSEYEEARSKFLQNNLNDYNKDIQDFASKMQKQLDNIELNKKNFQYDEDYYKLLKDLQNKIYEIKGKQIDVVTPEELGQISSMRTGIESLLNTIKSKTKNLRDMAADSEEAYQKMSKIKDIIHDNTRMSSDLRKEFESLSQRYNLVIKTGGSQAELEGLNAELSELIYKLKESGKVGNSIFTTLGQRIKNMSTNFIAMYFSLYDIARYVRTGVDIIKEYDVALTEMNKVSKESISTLKKFQKESFDLADAVGTTASAIQNSTADWLRLGESFEQAKQSAQDANVLYQVSEFESINEATEALVAMSAAYDDLEKSEINDVLNNIGNNYSIATDELARALQKSAGTLKVAGNDIYEATALITAGELIAWIYGNIYYRTHLIARYTLELFTTIQRKLLYECLTTKRLVDLQPSS